MLMPVVLVELIQLLALLTVTHSVLAVPRFVVPMVSVFDAVACCLRVPPSSCPKLSTVPTRQGNIEMVIMFPESSRGSQSETDGAGQDDSSRRRRDGTTEIKTNIKNTLEKLR